MVINKAYYFRFIYLLHKLILYYLAEYSGIKMIYFNNTATSYPKPQEVNDAIIKYLNTPPCQSARSGLEHEDDDYIHNCRVNLAKIFNADDPLNIVFTSGSTEALNLAIKGIGLEGGHVVSTSIEHNSVIRPLMTMKEKGEIELDFVECDKTGYVSPETIKRAVKKNTKAIVVNHCSNVTGSILDLEAISKIAHENNAVIIVDASQSAGLVPIDVKNWDIDYLAFTGHKNLFGLPGTGGLYMKEAFSLEPLKTGGTGVKSEVLVQPKEMTMYYEAGTPNLPGIVSLAAGTEFVLKHGIEKIAAHKADMVRMMINALKDEPSIDIYTAEEHNSMSNFAFNINGLVPEEVNYLLESSYDIHVRSGLHCAPLLLEAVGVYPWGTVRASASYFTTKEEVQAFIDAVRDIIKTFIKKK